MTETVKSAAIKLGQVVRDKITGFEGMAVGESRRRDEEPDAANKLEFVNCQGGGTLVATDRREDYDAYGKRRTRITGCCQTCGRNLCSVKSTR